MVGKFDFGVLGGGFKGLGEKIGGAIGKLTGNAHRGRSIGRTFGSVANAVTLGAAGVAAPGLVLGAEASALLGGAAKAVSGMAGTNLGINLLQKSDKMMEKKSDMNGDVVMKDALDNMPLQYLDKKGQATLTHAVGGANVRTDDAGFGDQKEQKRMSKTIGKSAFGQGTKSAPRKRMRDQVDGMTMNKKTKKAKNASSNRVASLANGVGLSVGGKMPHDISMMQMQRTGRAPQDRE